MQLTVLNVSEMFKVSEATIEQWVRRRELPSKLIAGQYRFNRTAVINWALAHRIKVETAPPEHPGDPQLTLTLAGALEAGGVHYNVPGEDLESAFSAMVSLIFLPEPLDRDLLLRLFLARESLGSTAVGEGIAIPHLRHPVAMHCLSSMVTLCFLERAIVYPSPDGKPVRILCSVLSPTITAQLRLLARLSSALHDLVFRRSLLGTQPRDVILSEAWRLENAEQSAVGSVPRAN